MLRSEEESDEVVEDEPEEEEENPQANDNPTPVSCSELMASNPNITIDNVSYPASAFSDRITGNFSELFKINQMTTTLSNGETKSLNSFGVIQKSALADVTGIFRVLMIIKLWLEYLDRILLLEPIRPRVNSLWFNLITAA